MPDTRCGMPVAIHTLLCFVFLSLIVGVVGCSKETREILADLQSLSEDMAKHFGESQPNVNRTVDTLTLTFINPSFVAADAKQKSAKAKEIATFAKAHYKAIDSCKTINVVVVKQKNYLIFKTGNSERFSFEKDEL